MNRCIICNQQVYNERTLCYLHRKYKEGLTEPHYDFLDDWAWGKLTIHTVWKEIMGKRLPYTVSELLESQLANSKLAKAALKKIKAVRAKGHVGLNKFRKIVNKWAKRYGNKNTRYVEDLRQIGLVELMKIEMKFNARTNPNELFKYVDNRIRAALSKHAKRNVSIVTRKDNKWMPTLDADVDTEFTELESNVTRPDVLYEDKERTNVKWEKLDKLVEETNPTERQILSNMLKGNPLTQTALAAKLKTSQQTLSYWTKHMFETAREIGRQDEQ
jgi:RNA polymerase sigma factor (sigma-70 family)